MQMPQVVIGSRLSCRMTTKCLIWCDVVSLNSTYSIKLLLTPTTGMMDTQTKRSQKSIIQAYLLIYNIFQTLGWAYILVTVGKHWILTPLKAEKTLWPLIRTPLTLFQYVAFLEVVHAMLRFTPSDVFVTFFQIFSRCGIILVATLFPKSCESVMMFVMLVSWAFTEVVRYGYYVLKSPFVNYYPRAATFLRYSLFLVLYPAGVAGELTLLWRTLQYFHSLDSRTRYQLYSISLPNAWNFEFYFYHFLIVGILLYIPIFPILFSHMLAQRRKYLSHEKTQ